MILHGSRFTLVFSLFLAGAIGLCPGGATAETMLPTKELKEAARGILQRENVSVVWVTAKVRLRRQSDGSAIAGGDSVLEVLGTIVEPSGLTVVSDSQFLPQNALAAGGQTDADADAVAEFSFVEIVLSEDITVPATVVYRDKDLDLAFIKPDEQIAKQRGAKFRPVDVASGHSLEVMDDVIHVARLDTSMDRAPSVSIGNVSSVVRSTRTFYGTTSEVTPGTPVFSADGTLLGIGVYRIVDGAPTAPVTLSSETLKVISEIAEATGFLAAKSEEMGTSLTEGLTLSLPEKPKAPAPAPAPKAEPKVTATPDNPASKPAPSAATGTAAAAVAPPSGPNIKTVPQPKEKPKPAPVTVVGAEVVPKPAPKPAPAPAPAPKPAPPRKTTPTPVAASKPAAAPAVAAVEAPAETGGVDGAEADVAAAESDSDSDSEKGGLKGFLGKIKFQSRRKAEKDAKDAKKDTEKPMVLEAAPAEEGAEEEAP